MMKFFFAVFGDPSEAQKGRRQERQGREGERGRRRERRERERISINPRTKQLTTNGTTYN